jgi:N-methylhydantoinase A/oxoprolinase/acetone carboxylase beta subunit
MKYRLGIDVGGTNTDAAILDEKNRIIAKGKTSTTPDVSSGIDAVVGAVVSQSKLAPKSIVNAMLGTTHATNAIVERKGLSKVGAIRLAGPSGFAIPPFIEWPQDLLDAMGCPWVIVKGGYEYNGTPLSRPDKEEIRRALDTISKKGAEALAVSCVFSPISDEQEMLVQELSGEVLGKSFPVTRSREIGSIGIIERENAAVLNAAIRGLAEKAYGSFQNVLARHGITAELFITQNDGTLMSIEYAKRYPVLTIASGPTNSLRGAAFLSGLKNAIVVDVGGTTTDVGVLSNGFPRESSSAVEMGGVRTNFRMPDLISIGLGGGSLVDLSAVPPVVGPRSVGYRITEEALVFGGATLTASDVAVAGGMASLGDVKRVAGVDARMARAALAVMKAMVEEQIDKMKTSSEGLPVILVGGGSILLPDSLQGASRVVRPEHFEVANAIGAAIAQVSGAVDGVFDTAAKGRDKVLAEVKAAAIAEAVKAGADEATTAVVEVEELPLAYLPANTVRFKVKAVGDLKRSR